MKKRFVTLFFVLILMLLLAACGGADTESPAPVVEEPVVEAPAAEEPAEAPAEEPVEEPTAEPMEEPMAEPDYDTDVYGVLDEIDLEGAKVTFWHRYDSGGRLETMDGFCADFNANNEYGITVECLPIGHYSVLYDNMIAGLTTGEVPND